MTKVRARTGEIDARTAPGAVDDGGAAAQNHVLVLEGPGLPLDGVGSHIDQLELRVGPGHVTEDGNGHQDIACTKDTRLVSLTVYFLHILITSNLFNDHTVTKSHERHLIMPRDLN
jgi:hypothetical protein